MKIGKFVITGEKQYHMDGRTIEYPFVLKHLRGGKGKVLDVGSSPAVQPYHVALTFFGYEVYCVDLLPQIHDFKMVSEKLHYKVCNIKRGLPYPDKFFDFVTCISTLEHIGMKGGRYGESYDQEGDIKAIREMARVLKVGGRLILTVPYGKRAEFAPYYRIYGTEIFNMLGGLKPIETMYYVPKNGVFVESKKEEAEALVATKPGPENSSLLLAVLNKDGEKL